MIEAILDKINNIIVGGIVGLITGFIIATIIGFVFLAILGGVYPSPMDFEELAGGLLGSAIIFGSFGVIVGFATGAGVAFMGIRPYTSLVWIFITGTAIALGGWIGKDKWLPQDIVQGDWNILIFNTLISVVTTWIVTRAIERLLGKRLVKEKITPWVNIGYMVAFAFLTIATPNLLGLVTSLFHY